MSACVCALVEGRGCVCPWVCLCVVITHGMFWVSGKAATLCACMLFLHPCHLCPLISLSVWEAVGIKDIDMDVANLSPKKKSALETENLQQPQGQQALNGATLRAP